MVILHSLSLCLEMSNSTQASTVATCDTYISTLTRFREYGFGASVLHPDTYHLTYRLK